MTKWILSNTSWEDAIGATKKPKRLELLSHNGLFICPVACCESQPYRSKRGCCFKRVKTSNMPIVLKDLRGWSEFVADVLYHGIFQRVW